MTKHLKDAEVEKIVELLDEWDLVRKLTWKKFCEEIHHTLGLTHTRQTLAKYTRIKESFDSVKAHASGRKPSNNRVLPSSLSAAASKIEKLDRKCKRLQLENDRLLEQFLVWQYNAHIHNMKLAQLNQPLPDKLNN